jgi:hypothetical protein
VRQTARWSTLSKRSAVGRVASALDNAAEAVNSILKTGYVYRQTFATREQACPGVGRWIDPFYNTRRLHSWCGGISRIDYERQHQINIAAQPAAESLCPFVRMRSSARHRGPPPCSLAHTPITSACEIALSTMAVASLNEMFISLFLCSMFLRLDPDVFLSDGAVAPPRHRHHPATVLEFADHAGPLS